MKAFKGFSPDLASRLGDHKKENCQFKPGETKTVESSKTAREGFHCCENPFECLRYYRLGQDRFFEVEAAGDIDEDENERIACTQITLVRELSRLEFALEGMKYIIAHPDRKKWKQDYINVVVAADEAVVMDPKGIAIARGKSPKAKAPEGAVIGLITERNHKIISARMVMVTKEKAGKWLTERDGKVVEA